MLVAFGAYVVFFAVEDPSVVKNVEDVGVFPEAGQPRSNLNNQHNLAATILALFCGAVCKDSPLADVLPAQDIPLNQTHFGRCLANIVYLCIPCNISLC